MPEIFKFWERVTGIEPGGGSLSTKIFKT